MEEQEILKEYAELMPIGRSGRIWLAAHKTTGRVYVKKCLKVFEREVYDQIAGIRNLHIPEIAAMEERDGNLYIIEEFINGETLEEQLNRGRVFSAEEAFKIIRSVCDALACLHDLDPPVIHRDIKLSNIMISHDGIVKLIDYNAARVYKQNMVQDTRLIGTQAYAAPEQFGFSQTDARTDIYALGVVFNYLLTGMHIHERIAPEPYGSVIRKCTQMDPDSRYRSARALASALERISRQGRNGLDLREKKDPGIYEQEADLARENERWKRENRLWPIPGFRSGKIWKMGLALYGYGVILYASLSPVIKSSAGSMPKRLTEGIGMLLSFLLSVAVATNYGGVDRLFPLTNHRFLPVRLSARLIWATLIWFGGVILLITAEMLLF